MEDEKPSERGLVEYPPNGRYEELPCTCVQMCSKTCKGECGCKACCAAYSDFLESDM